MANSYKKWSWMMDDRMDGGLYLWYSPTLLYRKLAMATSPSSCFDPKSCVFTSPRPSIDLSPHLDVISFLFSLTSSRSFHHRLAIKDASTGQAFTFLQFRRQVHSTARTLSFLGIMQHDVVLILSPNSVHFPIFFFAIISLGAVATTSNPLCVPSDILKQVKDSKAKLIVTTQDLTVKASEFALPVVVIDECEARPTWKANKNSSVKLLSEVFNQARNHRAPPAKIKQSDTAALLYSSGTTGLSKGVILSHRNFIAASMQMNSDSVFHNHTDLTFLCIIPMFHVYGLSVIVFAQLQRGNTLVTMPKFDFVQMLQAIETYRITSVPIVPPIMIALAKEDAVKKFDLSSVIEIIIGAAPVSKDIFEEVYQRLRVPDFRQGYGMTETCGSIARTVFKSEKNYESVGPLVPGMQAVVVDPSSGQRLPPNEQGELWVRGPNIMQGYLNNPEATASTLDSDGWLHTGDIVQFDSEGNLYILDRLKELIKYKGYQIAPAELEALLLTHSEILDAAVVPCQDDEAVEVPLAYVVRAPDSSLGEQDVLQFVATQVAPFKKVRKVKFIDTIPKSSSGKILRRQLRQNLQSKL